MYCVKCGVELDESADKCPLCDTKIGGYEPIREEEREAPPTPYSKVIMIPPKRQKRFIAFVISMVLLIPSVVCVVTNLLVRDYGIWSAYVVGTAGLVWVLFVLPFLKSVNMQLRIFLDAIAVASYVLLFSIMFNGDWYLTAALPCISLLWLSAAVLYMWLSKEKRDWPDVGMFVLAEIGVASMCIDAILERYFATGWILRYSLIIAVSCLLLIFFFLAARKNKHFRAWLSRNFYY